MSKDFLVFSIIAAASIVGSAYVLANEKSLSKKYIDDIERRRPVIMGRPLTSTSSGVPGAMKKLALVLLVMGTLSLLAAVAIATGH